MQELSTVINEEDVELCPYCGSEDIEHCYVGNPNNAGFEANWDECKNCGRDFNHA